MLSIHVPWLLVNLPQAKTSGRTLTHIVLHSLGPNVSLILQTSRGCCSSYLLSPLWATSTPAPRVAALAQTRSSLSALVGTLLHTGKRTRGMFP